MQREQGMTLNYGRGMAEALVELLAPACERIEIAGSVRRKKLNPNDIEIVAVPAWTQIASQLWGPLEDENLLGHKCNELLALGTLEKRPDSRGRSCWGNGRQAGRVLPRPGLCTGGPVPGRRAGAVGCDLRHPHRARRLQPAVGHEPEVGRGLPAGSEGGWG